MALLLSGATLFTVTDHPSNPSSRYTFRFDPVNLGFEAWDSSLRAGSGASIPVDVAATNVTTVAFTVTWGDAGDGATATFRLDAQSPAGVHAPPVEGTGGTLTLRVPFAALPGDFVVNASSEADAWAALNSAHPETSNGTGTWTVRVTYVSAAGADGNGTAAPDRSYALRAGIARYDASLRSTEAVPPAPTNDSATGGGGNATAPPDDNATGPGAGAGNDNGSGAGNGTADAGTGTAGGNATAGNGNGSGTGTGTGTGNATGNGSAGQGPTRSTNGTGFRFKGPDPTEAPTLNDGETSAATADWVTLGAATGTGIVAGLAVILLGRRLA